MNAKVKLGDVVLLQKWVASGPDAPEGNWYKDFGSFKPCGTGEFPKTVLTKDMQPFGEEIE